MCVSLTIVTRRSLHLSSSGCCTFSPKTSSKNCEAEITIRNPTSTSAFLQTPATRPQSTYTMLPSAAAGSTKALTSFACMYDPGSLKDWCLGGGLHASSTPVIALLLLIATPGTCDTSQAQADATGWDSTNRWAPASNPCRVRTFLQVTKR